MNQSKEWEGYGEKKKNITLSIDTVVLRRFQEATRYYSVSAWVQVKMEEWIHEFDRSKKEAEK